MTPNTQISLVMNN